MLSIQGMHLILCFGSLITCFMFLYCSKISHCVSFEFFLSFKIATMSSQSLVGGERSQNLELIKGLLYEFLKFL